MTRKTSVIGWSFTLATILLSSQMLATPLAAARTIDAAISKHRLLLFNPAGGSVRGPMPPRLVRGDCIYFDVGPTLEDGRAEGRACKYKVDPANSDVGTPALRLAPIHPVNANRKRQQRTPVILASSLIYGTGPTQAFTSATTTVSIVSPQLTQPRVCESPMRGRFFHDDVHVGLGCDDRIFDEPTALDGFARMRYHIPVPK